MASGKTTACTVGTTDFAISQKQFATVLRFVPMAVCFWWYVLQRTIERGLPIDSHGIRLLPTGKGAQVQSDLFMLMGLHSLWKCPLVGRRAEPPRTRSVRAGRPRTSVLAAKVTPPDWISILDRGITMVEFQCVDYWFAVNMFWDLYLSCDE